MDLIVEPDIYSPSIDEAGNYIDKIPSFSNLKNGLRCPCGSNKAYPTYSSFSAHCKTIKHQKWITDLNLNKSNFYIENVELKDTISNQRLIIARLEKDLNNKSLTIDYLTQQLQKYTCVSSRSSIKMADLLDFD
jgi:hypothetical protein